MTTAIGPTADVAAGGDVDSLRRLVDDGLRALLDDCPDPLRPLCADALGIATLDGSPARGGKRLRPLLCLLTCQSAGGTPALALPAAVAIECIHAFSLVHDDICDGDRERRGRPSLWAAAGMPLALNAGDGLQALGLRAACQAGPWAAALIHSATMTMIEGQHLDLSAEGTVAPTVADWERLAGRKTGALFAASAAAGAAAAGAGDEEVETFWRFGEMLGFAFQARDDILGCWGDPAVTGKPAGGDLERRKASLAVACGLEAGGEAAQALRAALADASTPTARLLELLDRCDARRRATALEDGYAAEVHRILEGVLPSGARLATFAAALQGRAA